MNILALVFILWRCRSWWRLMHAQISYAEYVRVGGLL